MRVDAIADPTQIGGWDIIDARTGLRYSKAVAYADDELHVIGIASICLTGDRAAVTRITEVSVPRVVIDPVRRAVLFNVGDLPVDVVHREEAEA